MRDYVTYRITREMFGLKVYTTSDKALIEWKEFHIPAIMLWQKMCEMANEYRKKDVGVRFKLDNEVI